MIRNIKRLGIIAAAGLLITASPVISSIASENEDAKVENNDSQDTENENDDNDSDSKDSNDNGSDEKGNEGDSEDNNDDSAKDGDTLVLECTDEDYENTFHLSKN